jgi:hypothetical protein
VENIPELLKVALKVLNVIWDLTEDPEFEKKIEAIQKDILDLLALIQAELDKQNNATSLGD